MSHSHSEMLLLYEVNNDTTYLFCKHNYLDHNIESFLIVLCSEPTLVNNFRSQNYTIQNFLLIKSSIVLITS